MPHILTALILPLGLLASAPNAPVTTPMVTGTVAAALPFAQPKVGLYTAGQPSADQLSLAKAAGVTTVIDLRADNEVRGYDEAGTAQALGLRYVRLPVAGSTEVTVDAARQLHALLGETAGPVLLHCASGNRAGALLALAAAHVDGADDISAMDLGRAAGLTSLAPLVEKQLPGSSIDVPMEEPATDTSPAR